MFGKLKQKMMGRKETASTGSTPVPLQQHHNESNARPGTAEAAMQPTSVAALREGNPAVDVGKSTTLDEQEKGGAELKDMLINMEKSKMLLENEDLKLQRVEDELKVANAELIKVKDSTDSTRRNRAIDNVKELRSEKTTCLENQDVYDGLVNTFRDQIAAARRVSIVEAFTQASGRTVDVNGKVELLGSPASGQHNANPTVDLETSVSPDEKEKRVHELRDKMSNMEMNKKFLRDEDLTLQRIEDELKVANAELFKVKDSTDSTRRNRAIDNVKRLGSEMTTCHENQDMCDGFINTLRDQMTAAERISSLH
jgi:hypothetical protein